MNRKPILISLWIGLTSQAQAWDAPPTFQVCSDYHCDLLNPVTLTPHQWGKIRALFTLSTNSPADEREQIKLAIARMEQLVGLQTGTWQDRAKNDGNGWEVGQLDCISESLNTTTYLQLMAQDNLLKWHQVKGRQRRNLWLFDIHWTATLMETQSRQTYAVDSWFLENGRPPVIQPIETWLSGQDFRQN